MKNLQVLGALAVCGVLVTACGGGGSDATGMAASEAALGVASKPAASSGGWKDREPAYTGLVVFGDSLSDVGTYRTPGIAALGGGKYTVNGPRGKNWTELLARELDVAAPCPAQTGLESMGPLASLAAPIENHPGCTNYAQGGARVTDPIGPSNKALYLNFNDPTGLLGQLTVPLVTQIQRHLDATPSGHFSGKELVAVLAGGNDLFAQLGILSATIEAGGDPNAAAAAAVGAMAQAGAELASYITQRVVAYGATRVVVVNLPDIGITPFALGQSPQTRALVTLMSQAFNVQLAGPLAGMPQVLLVDSFSVSQDEAVNPQRYGLSNVTDPACDFAKMPFRSSLVCSTPNTVIAGDISHYQFADDVHQTPYGYRLLAQVVTREMAKSGWIEPAGRRRCEQSAAGCALGEGDS